MTAADRVSLQAALEILFVARFASGGRAAEMLYDAIAHILNPGEKSCMGNPDATSAATEEFWGNESL